MGFPKNRRFHSKGPFRSSRVQNDSEFPQTGDDSIPFRRPSVSFPRLLNRPVMPFLSRPPRISYPAIRSSLQRPRPMATFPNPNITLLESSEATFGLGSGDVFKDPNCYPITRRVNPYYLGEPSRLFSNSSNPSVPLRITTDPSCPRRLYRDVVPTIPYSIPDHLFSSSYQVGQPPALSLSCPNTFGTGIPSLGDLLSPDYHKRLGHSSTFTQISPNIVKVNKDMFWSLVWVVQCINFFQRWMCSLCKQVINYFFITFSLLFEFNIPYSIV